MFDFDDARHTELFIVDFSAWGPGSKQHKINDWLPCPGVVLPGLVGCWDPA